MLATVGGIVLFCEDGGIFTAADARTDGKQQVAIAAGSNIVSFALVPPAPAASLLSDLLAGK